MVDLVVGLIFIFLTFSLVVSGVNEAITRALETRSRQLWKSLRDILDGTSVSGDARPQRSVTEDASSLTDRLYAHPLIRQLERGKGRWAKNEMTRLRSIPSTDFSRALLDVLVPSANGQLQVEEVRQALLQRLGDKPQLARPLLAIVNEAGAEVEKLRAGIEQWFDARMVSVSRQYKRNAKWWLLAIGIVVAGAMNVDAIHAAQELYRNPGLRSAVGDQASTLVARCKDDANLASCIKTKADKANASIQLPVGWNSDAGKDGFTLARLLGWLAAGIAISQGAPFWFDLLRKAAQLR